MYVYKKSDKNNEKPIRLSEAIRFKSLWNKSLKIEIELRDYFLIQNLMMQGEEEKTRKEIYKAIDCLKSFRENLKLKEGYKEE